MQLKPEPKNATQIRILEGAIQCIQNWGIDKTSLNDIAKQAGLTRPTVYSYFNNRDDVIREALLYSGYGFAEQMLSHMQQFDNAHDRLLESVIFAIENLPKEPYLKLITSTDLSGIVSQDALGAPEGQEICLHLFTEILGEHGFSDAELLDLIEFSVRITLSFITVKSPVERNTVQLRTLLETYFLSALKL